MLISVVHFHLGIQSLEHLCEYEGLDINPTHLTEQVKIHSRTIWISLCQLFCLKLCSLGYICYVGPVHVWVSWRENRIFHTSKETKNFSLNEANVPPSATRIGTTQASTMLLYL